MSEKDPWNEGLEPIELLVEFHVREMGQLAGRLMTALSLLTDLEDSYGWSTQGTQARETVRYSRLLVASVLRVATAAQSEQGDESRLAESIETSLDHISRGDRGTQEP